MVTHNASVITVSMPSCTCQSAAGPRDTRREMHPLSCLTATAAAPIFESETYPCVKMHVSRLRSTSVARDFASSLVSATTSSNGNSPAYVEDNV